MGTGRNARRAGSRTREEWIRFGMQRGCHVVVHHVWGPPRVPEALACIVLPKDDRGWLCGVCTRPSGEGLKELRHVGRDVDPHAHLAQHMRRLEQRDAVTGRCECVGRDEAINTHTDGGDVEVEGGAAAIVETGQVFEGMSGNLYVRLEGACQQEERVGGLDVVWD